MSSPAVTLNTLKTRRSDLQRQVAGLQKQIDDCDATIAVLEPAVAKELKAATEAAAASAPSPTAPKAAPEASEVTK